jgi:hypothetical protein
MSHDGKNRKGGILAFWVFPYTSPAYASLFSGVSPATSAPVTSNQFICYTTHIMIRTLIILSIAGALVWAPWMQQDDAVRVATTLFGPFAATCYDSEGTALFTGVSVRWYPFGRMVHTCAADYAVYFWGGAEELGGVYKSRYDIDGDVRGEQLSCAVTTQMTVSQESASYGHITEPYSGDIANTVDTSLFPSAREHISAYTTALSGGATFAGSFAVVEWECGAQCSRFGVIDVRTGLVVTHDMEVRYGLEYSIESDVLIVDPVATLPPIPEDETEARRLALIIANTPREYYRMTHDALSDTNYLVRVCIESAVVDYVYMADNTIYGASTL